MLESLHVKNIALIEETEVNFTKGLNMLTGETGAGKSLIIGSIQLALGAKADKGLIRNGAEYALVELIFSLTAHQEEKLKELEIYPEEGMLYLQRRIMPTKSVCKINGEMANGHILKEVASILLDMHGQHEHQSLLKKQKHFEILNSFCGHEMKDLMDEMSMKHQAVKGLEKELGELDELDSNRDKEFSLAQFECNEIEEAGLVSGEDELLEQKYRRMTYAKRIAEAASIAQNCIGGMEMENASAMTDRALKELHSVQEYDPELGESIENLSAASELLSEVSHSLLNYLEKTEFSQEEFIETENRLNTLNHLKSKYGDTLEQIFAYQTERQAFLDKLEDLAAYREKLQSDLQKKKEEQEKLAKKISKIRKEHALKLQEMMKQALLDLNFLEVQFEIAVVSDLDKINQTGFDEVEFLISLNPGESLKGLGTVASGGELSRIMLALKTVLAKNDEIETLVFDEIDAGISGKTAWKVSEKLAILGMEHQVICITHLPQIAAMADTHFRIQKDVKNGATTTTLQNLDETEMIGELARMLGSDTVTEAVLQNAKELKKMADDTKQY